mmetsp:Transcript_30489/g.71614  ORF Transcript_30489/g.71614 Transcript_30489/m.71614 type:complete len:202 (+) Transcript_30489:266-871(+)
MEEDHADSPCIMIELNATSNGWFRVRNGAERLVVWTRGNVNRQEIAFDLPTLMAKPAKPLEAMGRSLGLFGTWMLLRLPESLIIMSSVQPVPGSLLTPVRETGLTHFGVQQYKAGECLVVRPGVEHRYLSCDDDEVRSLPECLASVSPARFERETLSLEHGHFELKFGASAERSEWVESEFLDVEVVGVGGNLTKSAAKLG